MSLFLKYEQLLKNIDLLCNKIFETYSNDVNCKKGCCDCCIKDITVFPIEFDHIKSKNITVNHTKRESHCSLLKNKACQIYKVRPIVCRTQGLPLLYGKELSLCKLNFKNKDVSFSGDKIVDMEKVNLLLSALNIEYLTKMDKLSELKSKRRNLNEL